MGEDDSKIECWETLKPEHSLDMCCVEKARYKHWLISHKCSAQKEHIDSFFSQTHEIIIRGDSVGNSYVIKCDCGEELNITHFEHG